MASNPTNSFDFQNFYGSTLSSDITAVTLTIPLATVPTPTEGILIISPDSASPECIYYTSKGASSVTCASDGRGWDSTTGTAWTQGTTVIMAPTAYMLRMLKSGSLFDTTQTGWTTLGITPTYNATNGNHSYTLSTVSDKSTVLSKGMRLKFDRSTAAPTQCTSLNGTTQYYSKSSPSGMTFTDDFVVSAWVKLSSYAAGDIASRYNGTSGWAFVVNGSGQIQMRGFNAASANYSQILSYQSIPLNKWVHVAAQLDMSAFTATTVTSYVMIDGVDVPSAVSRGGTNPTALVQAGNLEIGSENSGTQFFPGKIAQVAIYSAKVTQAIVAASMNQTLTGSETSLISAYSFNNTINDLSANANNLTANGSAVATNADSPYAQGSTTGLTEYGIITGVTSSTITLQTPEGSVVPATGTMTSFYYSPHKSPYGFPSHRTKWAVEMVALARQSAALTIATWTNLGHQITVPIGEWRVMMEGHSIATHAGVAYLAVYVTLSTANNTQSDRVMTFYASTNNTSLAEVDSDYYRETSLSLTAQTIHYLNVYSANASTTGYLGDSSVPNTATVIRAELAYI